jgi:predicted dienelactone hydrolase
MKRAWLLMTLNLWIAGIVSIGLSVVTAAENIPLKQARQSVSIQREYAAASEEFQWFDVRRSRPTPAKIYYPAAGKGPFPIVLFSHGLGRSREDCAYLGMHWAGRGYVAVFVQHVGSDEAVWRGKVQPLKHLKEAYEDPATMRNRTQDMRFALDQLMRLPKSDSLAARLDFTRIGAAGFDLGAETALALAGQLLPDGRIVRDPRISAVIAMSPPVSLGSMPLEITYGGINVPCLYMRGSEDDGIVGATKAYQRRWPFDYSCGADQYLLTFLGGDHMIYAGHIVRQREMDKDARYQQLIRDASTLFWDAYLQHQPEALLALRGKGLNSLLGRSAIVEKKLVAGATKSASVHENSAIKTNQ